MTEESRKGYDGLRGGPGFQLEAGFWTQAPNGRYALFMEGTYGLAFTSTLRSADYNTLLKDTKSYTDGFLQIRLGLALLFYNLHKDEFFYY